MARFNKKQLRNRTTKLSLFTLFLSLNLSIYKTCTHLELTVKRVNPAMKSRTEISNWQGKMLKRKNSLSTKKHLILSTFSQVENTKYSKKLNATTKSKCSTQALKERASYCFANLRVAVKNFQESVDLKTTFLFMRTSSPTSVTSVLNNLPNKATKTSTCALAQDVVLLLIKIFLFESNYYFKKFST